MLLWTSLVFAQNGKQASQDQSDGGCPPAGAWEAVEEAQSAKALTFNYTPTLYPAIEEAGIALDDAISTYEGQVSACPDALDRIIEPSLAVATVYHGALDMPDRDQRADAVRFIRYSMDMPTHVGDPFYARGLYLLDQHNDPLLASAIGYCELNCDDPEGVFDAAGIGGDSEEFEPDFDPDFDPDEDLDSIGIGTFAYRYVDLGGDNAVHQMHIQSYGWAGGDYGGLEILLNYHRGFVHRSNGFVLQSGLAVRQRGIRAAGGVLFDGYGKAGGTDYNLPATLGGYLHLGARVPIKRFEVLANAQDHFYRGDTRRNAEVPFGDELTAEAGLGLRLGDGWLRFTGQRMMVAPGTFNAVMVSWVSYS